MPVGSSATANDQGKFIQDKLISLTEQRRVMTQFGDKVALPTGMGKTANFTQFNRTDVPVDRLSEGVTPPETPFTISTKSITTEQYGMYIALTDVIEVTTKHPVMTQALKLMADAMERLESYLFTEAVLDGSTNKQYWDGSRANMAAITASDTFTFKVFNKGFATMGDEGAQKRANGKFAAVMSGLIIGDILQESGANAFSQMTAASGDLTPLENGTLGVWGGHQIVESNFLPKFIRIATFTSIVAGAGGSLSGTVYHKITRKSLARGFEEAIQVEGNTVMGANTRLTFTAPSTSGFVYCIYAGTATGDANLYLAKENLGASQVFNLDTAPTSGVNPPESPPAAVTVHPIFVYGSEAVDTVEMNELSVTGTITPKGPSDSDPLEQRRKMGSKRMLKSGVRDITNCRIIFVASAL